MGGFNTGKSSKLIIIGICLIILLCSGGLFTIYITHTIKNDAEVVNKLGIIRGSIQRVVKLELEGFESNDFVEIIDSRIAEFSEGKIKIYDSKNEILRAIENLSQSWMELKEHIYGYREDPSSYHYELLFESSEEIWKETNEVVLISQIVSERKVTSYRISYIFFAINLVLVFIIVYLIKRYVKDNLEYLVNYDEMTKVYNRRYFNDYLGQELLKVERYDRGISLIIYDIDYFKRVNDQFGHDVGDSVLKELSRLVQANIRKSDILCRIGGEEFAIITPETNGNQAFVLSEKIRTVVENHNFQYVGKISVSLGVTQFVQGDDLDSFYKRADIGLYKAKNEGRNKSVIEQ